MDVQEVARLPKERQKCQRSAMDSKEATRMPKKLQGWQRSRIDAKEVAEMPKGWPRCQSAKDVNGKNWQG